MLEINELRDLLQIRPRDGHKGTFGTVLLVGGSFGMTGSMVLAGRAALRAGAGLVRLAIPRDCLGFVASMQPEYTTIPLPQDEAGRIAEAAWKPILEQARGASVVAFGPGLGRSEALNYLAVRLWLDLDKPLIVDADGLNALASTLTSWKSDAIPQPANVRIVTPHPGEFARLCLEAPANAPEQQQTAAVEWARKYGTVVVLKGAGTTITDGSQTTRNTTGNPGMGTGGSGDVLTGMMAAIYAQLAPRGVSPFDIARLVAHLHGEAGDRAAKVRGEISLIASDLIEYFRVDHADSTG